MSCPVILSLLSFTSSSAFTSSLLSQLRNSHYFADKSTSMRQFSRLTRRAQLSSGLLNLARAPLTLVNHSPFSSHLPFPSLIPPILTPYHAFRSSLLSPSERGFGDSRVSSCFPDCLSKSLLICSFYLPSAISHLFAAFLGAVALDFVDHLAFDWKLARSEGWDKPIKAIVRIAYFNCRIFSIIALGMASAFTTTDVGRHTDCRAYILVTQSMLVPLLNSASLVFVIRTISLYKGKRSVAYPLTGAWLVILALCKQPAARFDHSLLLILMFLSQLSHACHFGEHLTTFQVPTFAPTTLSVITGHA